MAESVSAANEVKLTEAERARGGSAGGYNPWVHVFNEEHVTAILGARLSAREPDNQVYAPDGVDGHRCVRVEAYMAAMDELRELRAAVVELCPVVPVSGVPTEADEVERIIAAKNRYRADRDEAWAELENHVCAPGVPTEAVRELADDHIPMPEWVDVYDSEQMVEVCGGCGDDWPCALVQRAAETNESGT